MIFSRIIDTVSRYIDTNPAVSIAVGFVFLLFLLKKPKYFMVIILILVAGLAVFDLFQKLAVKTGLGGF
jgi:chromate transport protein ChrA